MSWSPRGDTIVFSQNVPGDVGIASPSSSPDWRLIIDGPFHAAGPHVSPDGRWLAYVSDESGRDDVYVAALPDGRPRWQVSTDGGTGPRWSPTGQELFYRAGERLIAATVATEPTFEVRTRRTVFDVSGYTPSHDIFPGGDRFLMSTNEEVPQELVVVVNWSAALSPGWNGR